MSAALPWASALVGPLAVHGLSAVQGPGSPVTEAAAVLYMLCIVVSASAGSYSVALATTAFALLLFRRDTAHAAAAWPADAAVAFAWVAAALLVAWLARGARRRIALLTLGQAHGSLRHDLVERLAEPADEAGVVDTFLDFLTRRVGTPAAVWLGDHAFAAQGAPGEPPPADLALRAAAPDGTRWVALDGIEGRMGAVAYPRAERGRTARDQLMSALCVDLAHALVRARLADMAQRERLASESERLCRALLASVSHDLRTPLSTVMGAAETLRTLGGRLSAADRASLLETIDAEGRRLDHYIQNLVDVTRIGDGTLAADAQPSSVADLVASAVARLRRYQPDSFVDVRVEPGLPPLRVHGPLVEQALFNVLHNASKFSPRDAAIEVRARDGGGDVQIDVVDLGPGIPRAERERVFDMFYSADRGDPARAGTGLGLAISQSIVRAHGGEVTAHRGPDGVGTRMHLVIPVATEREATCH